MITTTRTTFSEIKLYAAKTFICACGRRLRRNKKFYQTLNPFNKTPDGQVKDAAMIAAENKVAADKWRAQIEVCTHGAVFRPLAHKWKIERLFQSGTHPTRIQKTCTACTVSGGKSRLESVAPCPGVPHTADCLQQLNYMMVGTIFFCECGRNKGHRTKAVGPRTR